MANKNIDKDLENKDVLSIQQLSMPFILHNDFNRIQMACSQLTQAIPLVNMEPPRVQSIYNKDMVEFSDMIVRAKEDMENLGVFKLQDDEFLLLKSENELELYPISRPILGSAFTSYHTFINTKKRIKKDQPIVINGNSDMDGNLQIGVNGLTGYMIYAENFEDSIIISESFANKLTHIEKDTIEFIINDNEYLLNLYGDDDNYECLPTIGDEINKNSRIVCAKRTIKNGWKSFMELSKKSNQKINFLSDDTVFYNKGKIIDIVVYSNLEEKPEEEKNDFYRSIEKYIIRNKADIEKLLNSVEPYLKLYKDKNESFTFGPNLKYYYNKFRKVNGENILTLNDKKFNGLLVKIIVEREVKAEIGDKLSNYHGGKGVITQILPDEKMPQRKIDGKHLDIILSPNSVIGRINLGQIHETTINRISEEVYKELMTLNDNQFIELYLEYMKDLLPERLHNQLNQIKKLKDKKLEEFINSIKNDGYLKIPQVPLEAISVEDMSKWYRRYNMNNDKILIEGKESMNPILTGHQYFLKLKHLPFKKLSACNYKKFGVKSLQPSKDTSSFKYHKIPISSSPNTIGEQETAILMALSKDMHILKELIFLKSSDVKNREIMLDRLFDEDLVYQSEFEDMKSISVMNLNYYLNVIGLTLNE